MTRRSRTGGDNQVNDSSWRSLSAMLGVACVVLIIAAGALLATSGESSPTPSQPTGSVAGDIPSSSASIGSSGSSGSPAPSPSATASALPVATPPGTPVAKASIAHVTFNNLQLDASTDPKGKARTFTFITDGSGPVGIAIVKSSPAKATTRICAQLDGGKPDCRTGTAVNYKGALTDTAHSVWVITLIGPASVGPTVDIAFSWPTSHAQITLTHGRFQGSSSPGIPQALNGFTATFKTVAAGNLTVSAAWTVITTNVEVTTEDLNAPTATMIDQKQLTSVTSLGTPGYAFGVGAGKSYRVSLRNLSADSQRPDLTAVISVP